MSWYEHVPKALGSIVPDLDADPKHQLRWRWSMALLVVAMCAAQIGHVLIACGWLAGFGVSGFAYAADVQEIQQAQLRTEIRQIESQLLAAEMAYCKARNAGKPTLFVYQMIQEAMRDYYSVSGQRWQRPGCEELGE